MENTKKINIGIVGYGNLGKAVERQIKNNAGFRLVGIFSKRLLKNTLPLSKLKTFKNKIDLLVLCGGSQNELEKQSKILIKDFNIIESYDNHSRLKTHIPTLNKLAVRNKKIALCSLGWDPGLFSLMRGLFDSLNLPPTTFWGKGLSQGHTNAIKNIPNVIDGLQFTLPNKTQLQKIKNGNISCDSKSLHCRKCFVVAKKQNRAAIKNSIVNMADYFKGYKTSVKFVSQKRLDNLKTFSHKGCVITKNSVATFALKLPSNPDFTAQVILTFARAYCKLNATDKFGAYTIFDLPIKYILAKDKFNYL